MSTTVNIAIAWKALPGKGQIEIINGTLLNSCLTEGTGTFKDESFSCPQASQGRMELSIAADNLNVGANPTMVAIRCESVPFTFFLRDVQPDQPIHIPAYGVAITEADDKRSLAEIQQSIQSKGLQSNLEQIDAQAEESFEQAALNTRNLISPIWLGTSRDVRIFEVAVREPMKWVDSIQPRFAGHAYFWEEKEYTSPRYGFVAGRGVGCTEELTRCIDEGTLPIFHSKRTDDDIDYEQVTFATLEKTVLTEGNVRGTHFLVSDGLEACNALTAEQKENYLALQDTELKRDEETVLCCQIKATNNAPVSRYAFFKTIHPLGKAHSLNPYGNPYQHTFDSETGFGMFEDSELVFGISSLDGKPLRQREIAVLLKPGQTCTLEFFLPHQPIPKDRAALLAKRNMQECLDQCRAFWKAKLSTAAKITLPEKRVEQMIYAGLLHLDLITYGLEPDGTLNPSNGAYSGLGSETTRNIAFYDSMGWHDIARRSLDFFLEKQHENGFMQNFIGYMLENGPILWCLCEHYRYTRDETWVQSIKPKVIKACDFLINWRKENKREELRGQGYGLLNGKVADPEDDERTFMLNGYAYLGLIRAAEMLAKSDPQYSQTLTCQAKEFREDIRTAFFQELSRGPVVPLGDGSWAPTAAPWVGQTGLTCLFTGGKDWWTHGTMMARDDMLGPMHLVFQEVLDVDEQATTFLLNYHDALMHSRNVTFSQPYYGTHPWIHLMRGEPKRFIKAHYNTVAAMADRETYSFWEHLYHESAHKTGDEAMFLLQSRWMLYMENGNTLRLLPGVPRAWLEDGKSIKIENAASYFGPFSLSVESKLQDKTIEVEITCDTDRKPDCVEIRLPHPLSKKAMSVDNGEYDPERESVTIQNFKGHATLRLVF